MDFITWILFASFVIFGMLMDNIHSKITQILKDNGYSVAKSVNEYSDDMKNFKKVFSIEKNKKNIIYYKLLIKKFYILSFLVVTNFILALIFAFISL